MYLSKLRLTDCTRDGHGQGIDAYGRPYDCARGTILLLSSTNMFRLAVTQIIIAPSMAPSICWSLLRSLLRRMGRGADDLGLTSLPG